MEFIPNSPINHLHGWHKPWDSQYIGKKKIDANFMYKLNISRKY